VLNFQVVRAPHIQAKDRPGRWLTGFSWAGIVFLTGFGVAWLYVRLIS